MELERAQIQELRKLKRIEASRISALARGRAGRSSLISGSERGIIAGTRPTAGTAFGTSPLPGSLLAPSPQQIIANRRRLGLSAS